MRQVRLYAYYPFVFHLNMTRGVYRGAVSGGRGRRGAVSVYQPVTYHTTRGPITRLAIDKQSPQKSPRKKPKINPDAYEPVEFPHIEPLVNIEPLKLKVGKVGMFKCFSLVLLIL